MGSVAQRGRKFATAQSQTLSKVDDGVSSGVNKVSETASGVADKANPVSQFNNFVDKKKDAAEHASKTSEFVSDAITSGEFDLQRASELGVISQTPAEGSNATVYTDGDSGATMASYQDSSGRTQTVNLTEEQQAAGDLAQRAYESVNNWEAAQTAGQKTSEAGKAAGGSTKKGAKMAGFTIPRNVAKVGSSALVGAAGGNPYLAYSGTRKSSSNMIIGPDKSVRSGRRPPEESTLDEFGKAAAGEAADSGDIK